jgi:hypothetical protein
MNIKQKLDAALKRSVNLHGYRLDANGLQIDADTATRAFLTQLCSIEPDPKAQAAVLVEAWGDKSGNLQNALNAVRVEQVGNYIATDSTFMSSFFEVRTLADNEEAYVHNDTMNEIRCGAISEDGKPDSVRVIKPESKYAIGLQFIASEAVKVKTLDIYKGNVRDVAMKTFDIAFDLRFKLDRVHYNLLVATPANGGCFGAFSYEQTRTAKEKRIFLPHSGIVTTHLPVTNDIDISGVADENNPNRTNNKFSIKVIKEIIRYSDSWANVFPAGRLVPTGEIIVPSSDIIDIADDAAPANNSPAQRIQEEINAQGFTSVTYLGRTWKFIADVTIPKGTCFPRFQLLPGISFQKPSLDREFTELNEVENWEKRWQRKLYGAAIISQNRIRAIRIKYAA